MLRDVMVLRGVGRDLDVVDRLSEGRNGGEGEHDGWERRGDGPGEGEG